VRALLDTCTFVWLVCSPDLVPPATRAFLERETDAIVVSAASVWELAIKRKLGKLGELSSIARDLTAFVREAIGTYLFEEFPMSSAHAALAGDLPLHHRDPFDRMLIAQARIEDLIVISPDRTFDRYAAPRRWD
jgi:PIN domain nuclease of toxin-antitoxin system